MAALHAVLRPRDHVVAQVVKAEFRVRAVRDIGQVSRLLAVGTHAVLNKAHVHTHELVNAAHPFAVALGQVIIHGNDMHVVSRQCVQITGQRGHERLAFAGLHLGTVVQGHAANQLHIEVTHAEHAQTGLAYGGERLGQHVVEVFTTVKSLAELDGLRSQLLIGKRLHRRLEFADTRRHLFVALHLSTLAGP